MTGDERAGRVEVEVGPALAHIERLQTDRNVRDACGQFFVEGVRNLLYAVDGGFAVETLLASEKLLTSSAARAAVRRLARAGAPLARASPEQFRSVSRAERASGIGAVLRQRIEPLHRMAPRRGLCWIVLDRVRSPGNLGSLVRTSAAMGGAGFILVGGAIDPFDPAVVRGAMGALFQQIFVRTGPQQLRHWARRHQLQVVGASPDGPIGCHEARYRAPPLLVLGDERQGLDDEQRGLCDQLVRIPMVNGIDSLNLAVAGSILMYEVLRRSLGRR
jgi:RNA methyltransferase, TrmH family